MFEMRKTDKNYPKCACRECCQQNSPIFYDEVKSKNFSEIREEETIGESFCPVCKLWKPLYKSSDYDYPIFPKNKRKLPNYIGFMSAEEIFYMSENKK